LSRYFGSGAFHLLLKVAPDGLDFTLGALKLGTNAVRFASNMLGNATGLGASGLNDSTCFRSSCLGYTTQDDWNAFCRFADEMFQGSRIGRGEERREGVDGRRGQ
jgi:hypothetical protein